MRMWSEQRIALTSEPIRFSFIVQIYIDPQKGCKLLDEGYHHPPKEKSTLEHDHGKLKKNIVEFEMP